MKRKYEEKKSQVVANSESQQSPRKLDNNPNIEEIQRKLIAERDHRLQAEIRDTQRETLRLEMAEAASFEEEQRKIVEASEREQKILMNSLEKLNEQIFELFEERERLNRENKLLSDDNNKALIEIRELEKEVEVFENGIRVQKSRCRDNELQHERSRNEQEEIIYGQIDNIKANCERLTNQLQKREEELKQELSAITDQHEKTLEALDVDVSFIFNHKNILLLSSLYAFLSFLLHHHTYPLNCLYIHSSICCMFSSIFR